MTSAQVVETSVTNNTSFQNYTDRTITQYEILILDPGFKPFTETFFIGQSTMHPERINKNIANFEVENCVFPMAHRGKS